MDGGKLKRVSAKGGEPTEIEWQAEIQRATPGTETITEGIEEMAVNRDGSLVAIVVKGVIFFVKPGLEKEAIRITDWPGPDGQLRWSPDGSN